MKCEYCNKKIGKKESYVTEHWIDVYNKPHERVLHDTNGQNFMDNCYHRFNSGFSTNTTVEIDFPKCKRPQPDYDMLIQVKNILK